MPNYPRKVLLSKSRKAKYFTQAKDEGIKNKPKYNSNRYQWKEHISSSKKVEIRLYDTALSEWVVKNNRVAGTEKWEVINGQKYWSDGYPDYIKGKILNEISSYFSPFLQALKPIDKFPLYIECEIHDFANDSISGKRWDVGNRGYPYCKIFDDMIQPKTEHNELHVGAIPDDSNQYVMCPSHPIFFPIQEDVLSIEPHLIFKIYHVCQ